MKNKEFDERDIGKLLDGVQSRKQPNELKKRQHLSSVEAAWRDAVRENHSSKFGHWVKALAATIFLGLSFVFLTQLDGPISNSELTLVLESGDVLVDGLQVEPRSEPLSDVVIETGRNSFATLANGEQSRLQLDEQTKMTVDSDGNFALEVGRVYVDNEAPEKQILIETRFGQVRNIGTQFSVNVSESELIIAVREGSVDVDPANGSDFLVEASGRGSGNVIRLSAGQQATYSYRSHHDESWGWTRTSTPAYPEGVSTLKEVVDWAARQTGRQVVFVEPILEYEIAGEVLNWPEISAINVEADLEELGKSTATASIRFTPEEIVIDQK
jgi:hypothetical protein